MESLEGGLSRIREEEGLSVSRLCEMVRLSRATYYRRRRKKSGKRGRRSRPVREVIEEQARELAQEHPCYGYRKIWALAQKKGLQGSLSTVYRILKQGALLLEASYQQELRENARSRKVSPSPHGAQ